MKLARAPARLARGLDEAAALEHLADGGLLVQQVRVRGDGALADARATVTATATAGSALRIHRQDRQARPLRRPPVRRELGDRGADQRDLGPVVEPAFLPSALLLADVQLVAVHHHAFSPDPADV